MNSPPLAGGGINQGGRGRPPSASSTTSAPPHFLPLPNRGRSAAAADATNHNGNHVRQLNGACNNNAASAAGDSGFVEDIYAKVDTRSRFWLFTFSSGKLFFLRKKGLK